MSPAIPVQTSCGIENPRLDRCFDKGVVFRQTAFFMDRTGQRNWNRRSHAATVYAAAFVFFLLYTAPHRVHHFFEQAPLAPDEHHGHARSSDPGTTHEHDHEGNSPHPRRSDCAAQMAAQSTHFASPPLIEFPFSTFACARAELVEAGWAASFNPSPFSQRAPPRV